MNKNLFIVIAAVFLLGGGFYVMSNKKNDQTNEHGGHMNNKSTAQSHSAYEIDATQIPKANQILLNEPTTIKYRIKNDKGEVVKDFAIAHEKLMHFIIVRKDLMQFQHLHPDFHKDTGEFSVDVIFTVDGPYRFFADFTPGENNPTKIPVTIASDLPVGDVANFQPHAVIPDTKREMTVPPDYKVTYTIPSALKSQEVTTYSLVIEKNNQEVALEKYLGALGHSVVLKEGTLTYIHTHAGEQVGHEEHAANNEQIPNKIDFSTTFPESGTYKIFTQFKHRGEIITTDYTIKVD